MIAIIRTYGHREENKDYFDCLKYEKEPDELYSIVLDEQCTEWIKRNAYIDGSCLILDGNNLIDFEDFYRANYEKYVFTYCSRFRSNALSFQFFDSYGIKVVSEDDFQDFTGYSLDEAYNL